MSNYQVLKRCNATRNPTPGNSDNLKKEGKKWDEASRKVIL